MTETNSVNEHTATEHSKTIGKINDHIDEEHRQTKKEVVQQIGENTTRAHKETRNLVSEELGRLRIEDNEEHAKIRGHVDQQVQTLQAVTLSAATREKFLKSLNFQGCDQRFNDVKEAHHKTFQWLFDDIDQADSGNSSLQDDGSEESDDSSSYHSGDSNGPLNDSQELDFAYEDLVAECRGMVKRNFSDWLKSKEVLYWIKAKAGAGKSTLMKFLCSDSRTIQLLYSATSGKTIVLIHFFYLMGPPMQCNIKGLLCTLLYQLLQQDEDGTWIAELFRRNPSLKTKESDSNWSEKELKNALFMTLRLTTVSNRICVFLDGLDEVRQSDGKHKLLNLVDWLKASSSLKLCVSSRPEEEFNQALSSASSLELHNLTAPDIYRYVRDLLAPLTRTFSESVPSWEAYSKVFGMKYYPNTLQTLTKTVVSRSDGVFLWADIAIRSLQRGITYGDTWSTIQQRLDLMPPGLSELYASMWSRPGEDARLYRAEAALCFNLVLDWNLCGSHNAYTCWNPKHSTGLRALDSSPGHFCSKVYQMGFPPNPMFSLFHLALAKHRVLRGDLNLDTGSPTNLIWGECVRLYKRLPILCAGLLETAGSLSYVNEVGHEIRNPDIQVRFIHRTAKEFFTDTVEGREILQSDTSSFEKRLSALLRSSYTRGLAFRSSGAQERELFCLPLVEVNAYELVRRFSSLRTRLQRKEWLEELDACQAFIDCGAGIFFKDMEFLGLAIQCGYKEYLERGFNNPSLYTPAYKSYLLVCGSSIRPDTVDQLAGMSPAFQNTEHWTTEDWTRWMEITKYLLSQGCKSEQVIVQRPLTYKVTGLEAFFWSLLALCRRDSWDKDSVPCDLIIETLRQFSEAGANFMQPVYGYYGHDGLYNQAYIRGRRQIPVVVEWSIFGALTRAVKTPHRDKYFCGRLEEFLITIRMDKNSLDPRIIAVCQPYDPKYWNKSAGWMEKAKRVSGKHEERLMNNISLWISHNDSNAASKMEKLTDELNQIVRSTLDDDDLPEGVFGCFRELGFLESWPRFLAHELQEMGVTKRRGEDGKWRFPDGVTYPLVKYVDQIK
jgi:hypothetical protein